MTAYNYQNCAYVTEDGSWSSGTEIITFDVSELSAEQWEILAELPDSEKIIFAQAVIHGDDEAIQQYMDDYFG